MRILILGGTTFLGRHLVDAAVARGHEVTILTRGRRNPEPFPAVERLVGDRLTDDLAALSDRTWDSAIDTSAIVPRAARYTAARLQNAVGHYVYLSSISVYEDFGLPGITENDPLRSPLLDDQASIETGDDYGSLKAGCEQLLAETFGDRLLIARPSLIVGPYDPTDRFTYWVRRLAQGGDVLAPSPPEQWVQLIDARDLAAWLIKTCETQRSGVYNVGTAEKSLTLDKVLDECARVTRSDALIDWVHEDFLLEAGVAPWTELPLWIPSKEAPMRGFTSMDTRRVAAAGLKCRPLAGTVRDLWSWDRSRQADLKAGLSPEREQQLLAQWRVNQARWL